MSHLSGLPRAGETEARADQGTPEHPAELGGVTPLCGGGQPQGPDSRAEVSERAGLASLAGWGEASWDTPLGQASRKEDSAPGRESSLGKGPGAGPTLVWGGPGRQMLPGRALQEIGLDSEKVALPCSARTFLLPIHGRASCRLCPPAQLAGHLCGWYRQRPGPSWPGRHQAVLTLAPSPQPSWHVAAQPASRPLGTISCLFLPSLGRAWGRLPLLTLESREYGLGEARLGRDRGRRARGYKTIPGTPTACLPWGPGDARMEASTPRATGRGSGVLQTVMRILASWHQTWRPGGFLSPA